MTSSSYDPFKLADFGSMQETEASLDASQLDEMVDPIIRESEKLKKPQTYSTQYNPFPGPKHCNPRHSTNNGNEGGMVSSRWEVLMDVLGLWLTPPELTSSALCGKFFPTIDEAEEFFNLYARAMGFKVRKGRLSHKGKTGVTLRTWVCNKEGERDAKHTNNHNRKREPKAITRVNCKAELRISHRPTTKNWVVIKFHTQHTHVLGAPHHIKFLTSNNKNNAGAIEMAKVLRTAGVKSAQIMSYMALMLGGYDKVPFTSKDLFNKLRGPVQLSDCDASITIGYLQHKGDKDADFFGRYTYDDNNRLVNLFWADSRCRAEYRVFGDALTFDTTYRTNKYGRPLLVFVGINNHYRSSLFGFAIMEDETYQSYKWALTTFVDCMGGKKPTTVMTDGDLAMRRNIIELLPETVHRLCSWHVQKNATSNVKNTQFTAEMKKFFSHDLPLTTMERHWNEMIQKFCLQDNKWIKKIYEQREQWAGVYFQKDFFGGMNSTQRCEGMNWMLKKDGTSNMSLVEFVRGIDVTLSWLRHKEAEDDFQSTLTRPQLGRTNMPSVEAQCANIYTRSMFYRVREEIYKEGSYKVYNVKEVGTNLELTLRKYSNLDHITKVGFNKLNNNFDCNCNSFLRTGIPCRHVFCAMKELNIGELPDSMIMKRWTNKARELVFEHANGGGSDDTINVTVERGRFGAISDKCSQIAYYSSLSSEGYSMANEDLDLLLNKLQSLPKHLHSPAKSPQPFGSTKGNHIKNPLYARTKGEGVATGSNSKKQKRCTQCKKTGHNKKTCRYAIATGILDTDGEDELNATCNLNSDADVVVTTPSATQTIKLKSPTEIQFFNQQTAEMDTHIDSWLGQPFGM